MKNGSGGRPERAGWWGGAWRRWARTWAPSGATLLLGLLLAASMHATGKWIRPGWGIHYTWILVPGLLAWMWAQSLSAPRVPLRRLAPLLVALGVCLLYLVSSTVLHRWFYFNAWLPNPQNLWASGLLVFALGTAVLVPVYAWNPRGVGLIPLLVLLGAEGLSMALIWHHTGGQALYRTDHPSFMLRLWEFTRGFPQLVHYLPFWNGGVVDSANVTSGTAAPALAMWPLLNAFPVHAVYTLTWILLFLVIVPWVGVASVRAMGGSRTAAWVAGTLALGISQQFYLWALHFGTIGAAFTAAMTMPVCALGYRVVHQRRRGWGVALALVVSGFLLLQWLPLGLVGAGLGLSMLVAYRRWTWKTWRFLLLCAGGVLVLDIPWLHVILGQARETVAFVASTDPPAADVSVSLTERVAAGVALLHRASVTLRGQAMEAHPLLLFFGGVALVAGGDRRLRAWFLPVFTVLALAASFGREWLPHSQLSRMVIPLAFASVPPAAILLGRLLRAQDRRLALARAAVIGLLAMGGLNVALIAHNRGPAPYVALDDDVQDLVAWLHTHTPPDGRILFAGKCVHRYGGGNVAYLPLLAKREMMAVDFYGFPPEQVIYEYPPRAFRRSPELMQTFFDAYNVTHLVTYHEMWKRQLRDQPDLYTECANLDEVTIFERKRANAGLFHLNAGHVRAGLNRLDVEVSDPGSPAVIAYNWVEGLRAPPPVELYPHTVVEGLVLIGIRPHGQQAFTIRYREGRGDGT